MGSTRTISSIDSLIIEATELNLGESIKKHVPPEFFLDLDDVVDEILLKLPRNMFYVGTEDDQGSITITKTHGGCTMKKVSTVDEVRNLMRGCNTDQTFQVRDEVDPVQFQELIDALERSGDLTVADYEDETSPRTVTILCRN